MISDNSLAPAQHQQKRMKSTQQLSPKSQQIPESETDSFQKQIQQFQPPPPPTSTNTNPYVQIGMYVVLIVLFVLLFGKGVFGGMGGGGWWLGGDGLEVLLRGRYGCGEVGVVKDLEMIRKWIAENHTKTQMDTQYKKSQKRCGILSPQSITPTIITYPGYQLLTFESPPESPQSTQLLTEIKSQNMQRKVRISWETVGSSTYTVLQFYRIVDNQELSGAGSVYVVELGIKLGEFYRKEGVGTVGDFGCGLCGYGGNLKRLGFGVQAFDSSPMASELTNNFASTLSLSQRQDLGKRYDWVQSFQARYQIQDGKTSTFIQNLARHSIRGVILSWSTGQQNITNNEIIKLFESRGFEYDQTITSQFRKLNNLMWLKNSIMVFRRTPQSLKQIFSLNQNHLSYSLQTRLHQKYYCKQIFHLQQKPQNNKKVLLLSQIDNWLRLGHDKTEIQLREEESSRKCGIIQTKDMKAEYVKYRGLEVVVFQAVDGSSGVVGEVLGVIGQQGMENFVKLKWEKIQGKTFAFLHFYKLLVATKKGYYSGNDQPSILRQHYFVQDLNNMLIQFYKRQQAQSIVDFGCGLCTYALNLQKQGFVTEGYDGNPFTYQLSHGYGKVMDLSEKQDLGVRFDWVQSFEVGEQLEEEKLLVYVGNLARHAKRGIVMSWAVVGQNGFYHVTNRNNDEVIKMVEPFGFKYDEKVSNQFRSKPNIMWFKNTIMVFRSTSTPSTPPPTPTPPTITPTQKLNPQNKNLPLSSLPSLSSFTINIGPNIPKIINNFNYEDHGIADRIQIAAEEFDFGKIGEKVDFGKFGEQLGGAVAGEVYLFGDGKDGEKGKEIDGRIVREIGANQAAAFANSKVNQFELAARLAQNPNQPQLLQQQYLLYNQKYNIGGSAKQPPICLYSYSSPNSPQTPFLPLLQSLLHQNYTNFHILLNTEHSPQNTAYNIYSYLSKQKTHLNNRIKIVRNLQYLGEMGSLLVWVKRYCGLEDVVVVVGAQGWFVGQQGLGVVGKGFGDGAWVGYGNYLNYFGDSKRYTRGSGSAKFEGKAAEIRATQGGWTTSGALAFHKKLFDKIPLKYFLQYSYNSQTGQASPVFHSSTKPLVYSLLELSGESKIFYIDSYLTVKPVTASTQNCWREEEYFVDGKAKIQNPLMRLASLEDGAKKVEGYKVGEGLLTGLKERYGKFRDCKVKVKV